MRLCLILIPIIMLFGFSLSAQFKMNEFLGSNTSAYELEVIKQQQDYLNNNDFSSPFLREIEFRMRSRSLESSPDDFRFRVSPINPWERKANDNYVEVLDEQLNTQWKVDFSQVLFRRYSLLIELFYHQEQLEINSNHRVKYERLMSIYGQQEGAAKEILQIKKSLILVTLNV